VRVRYLDRDAAVAALRVMAARMGVDHPEIEEIRLFGSLARGERNPRADADLLVVLDDSPLPFHQRLPRYKPVGGPLPLDMTICTRAELHREIAAENKFILRIVRESLVLYARSGESR
jgi:predicted nucleotidyltransferase